MSVFSLWMSGLRKINVKLNYKIIQKKIKKIDISGTFPIIEIVIY